MTRYCLELRVDSDPVIHELDCAAYDLGTLLGLGCVVDLGEFATLAEALSAITADHPGAVRCPGCCHACAMYLPILRRNTLPIAINALSG